MSSLTSATLAPTFTPALPPPPGVTPSPDDPPSLAKFCHVTVGICISIITIVFFLRLYSRVIVTRKIWLLEDYLTTIAWACTVAFCGILEATMLYGGGKHAWDISQEEFNSAAYWFNVSAIFYGITICITKLAVLSLYRRVFSPKPKSLFDIAIIFLIIICIGFYGATTFVKIFQCNPRSKIKNPSMPGKCLNLSMVLNASGGFNFVTDFLILFLPIGAVWKLKMDRKKKLLVIAVFTFGLCAPIFALIGFIVRLRTSANKDQSWHQPQILLWAAAEISSGNICVGVPELGPLFLRCFSRPNRPQRRPPIVNQINNPSPDDFPTPQALHPESPRYGRNRQQQLVLDSGIGASPNEKRRGVEHVTSFRQRVLGGLMDTGLGSNVSATRSGLDEISERSGDRGESSNETVEVEQININQGKMMKGDGIV